MEDVLEVYTRPYDPKRPQVCMDETSKQMLREVRAPLPGGPGQPTRIDPASIMNTSAAESPISFCSVSLSPASAGSM